MAKRKIDFTLREYWNQDSLLVYKEAVSRYPYCAPARVSFLLNLRALDDPDYERELAFTALAVPDRLRLQEEVRAAEQAAAVARERGERRLRQATARWVAASATTAAVGRLMSAGPATAPAEQAFGAVAPDREGLPMFDREVDFRAVAANEPAIRTEAASEDAADTADIDDSPARSRSARRNARRLTRQWEQKTAEAAAIAAAEAAVAKVAAKAAAEKAAAERAALEAASKALAASEAAPEPAVAKPTAPKQAVVTSPAELMAEDEAPAIGSTISAMLAAEPEPVVEPEPVPAARPEPASAVAPQRPRREVFNPWAEVFTAKHTISDWLQSDGEAEEPLAASTSAEPVAEAPAVHARRVTPKSSKSSAKSSVKTSVKTGKAAKSAPVSAGPAPGYIDPNELIDRFLKQDNDHILIQVDESRDYSTFDPDQNSLREDWSMGSETLAQLYLKQGSPDKAIEIYRYLSLKFPEKNRYFASLIREAEKVKRGQ